MYYLYKKTEKKAFNTDKNKRINAATKVCTGTEIVRYNCKSKEVCRYLCLRDKLFNSQLSGNTLLLVNYIRICP